MQTSMNRVRISKTSKRFNLDDGARVRQTKNQITRYLDEVTEDFVAMLNSDIASV